MSLPKPYYQDDFVTLYHGDCREILPFVSADAVVTDPPYGIGADRALVSRARARSGNAFVRSTDHGTTDWDHSPITDEDVAALMAVGEQHVVWGGNYFRLPPSSGWLVWDKETGANTYADCELAWTDLSMPARLKRFQWKGMFQEIREARLHPTQKPLPVMRWCIDFLPEHLTTILDPYAGSGTTLRAAKDRGRKSIGIEIEESYCEIAARRCSQEVLDFGEAA